MFTKTLTQELSKFYTHPYDLRKAVETLVTLAEEQYSTDDAYFEGISDAEWEDAYNKGYTDALEEEKGE